MSVPLESSNETLITTKTKKGKVNVECEIASDGAIVAYISDAANVFARFVVTTEGDLLFAWDGNDFMQNLGKIHWRGMTFIQHKAKTANLGKKLRK